jgi:TRAP-type mannitol/chloroaromatic compound transport system permease small subunit
LYIVPVKYLILRLGAGISWLCLILVLLISGDVLLRYAFNTTRTWIIDLEWHLFSLIFLFGAASTWLKDKHVRVDLFYARWSDQRKALVNILGTLFFLLPWCVMLIWTSTRYALASWAVGEGSPDPNGLPVRYLIKAAIVLGFVLLAVSSLVRMKEDIALLRNRHKSGS